MTGSSNSAGARAEHRGRLGGEVLDQPPCVVSIRFQPVRIVLRSVENAARVPATIVGHDRKLGGQPVRQWRKAIGITVCAGNEQQQWPGAACLVVKTRARNL